MCVCCLVDVCRRADGHERFFTSGSHAGLLSALTAKVWARWSSCFVSVTSKDDKIMAEKHALPSWRSPASETRAWADCWAQMIDRVVAQVGSGLYGGLGSACSVRRKAGVPSGRPSSGSCLDACMLAWIGLFLPQMSLPRLAASEPLLPTSG